MPENTVLLEVKNSVAPITLNALRRLNAMSAQLMADLNEALDGCSEDRSLRALISKAQRRS